MGHTMMWVKRSFLMGLVCSVSSGCMMYRLEELRNTTPSGTPFQNELSRMYMDFATKEEKDYDWQDSWYFADKGLMLAYGKDVGPEELDGWNIDGEAKLELEKARIRVMDMLTPALKERAPSRAAAIQYNFDCWVEQQEEGWQEDDIANCRNELMHALSDGADFSTAAPVVKKPKAAPVKLAKPKADAVEGDAEKTTNVMPAKPAAKAEGKAMATETASYAVFFEAGKPDVSAPGKNVINEVVNSVKGKSDYVVILHVAAIPAAQTADKDLPAKRISVVKKLLTDGGVSESSIVSAEGADAGKQVARRIELFLNE